MNRVYAVTVYRGLISPTYRILPPEPVAGSTRLAPLTTGQTVTGQRPSTRCEVPGACVGCPRANVETSTVLPAIPKRRGLIANRFQQSCNLKQS